MNQNAIPTDRRPARASRALRVLFVAVALVGAGLSLGACTCADNEGHEIQCQP